MSFDVTSQLPEGWPEDIGAIAAEADFRDFPRTPILSREAADVTHIARGRVHANQVQQGLPWLYKLYRGPLPRAGRQKPDGEPIEAALDDRYGVVLNVQRGNKMRFECHVDSNPVTGLLFFTDHPAGGGELVVGHDPAAVGVDELERDCTRYHAAAGAADLLRRQDLPALRAATGRRAGRARRGGDELLHHVVPGIDPPARAEPSPLRRRVTGRWLTSARTAYEPPATCR